MRRVVHSWRGADLELDWTGYAIYVPLETRAVLADLIALAERFGFRGHKVRVARPMDRAGFYAVVLPEYRYRCDHGHSVGPPYCPDCKAHAEGYYAVNDSEWPKEHDG